MREYTDVNNDIKGYYEYQKSIITAQKNLGMRFENRTDELSSIKTSLDNKYLKKPQYIDARSSATTASLKLPQRQMQSVSVSPNYKSNPVNTQAKVVSPSKEIKLENKTSKPLFQRIKNWFSKGKTAISNFFSESKDSTSTQGLDKSSAASISDKFVSPRVINNNKKSYATQSNLDYLRYNNNVSNHSSVDRISGVSSTSQTYRDSSHIDSLAFARYLKNENNYKSSNSSSHVDSLEFARLLKENDNKSNCSRRAQREIEER